MKVKKEVGKNERRGNQDYKRLELIDTRSLNKVERKTDSVKKGNVRKTVHLSVLDKVKGLSSEGVLEEKNQVEIALRVWSKGSVSVKGGNGRSIQIVNKGKRKQDRGVDFTRRCEKDIKENTGSYTRFGWKDRNGRKKVNQVLNERGEHASLKRRGRGRREKTLKEESRRWLNIDRRTQTQVKERRKGRVNRSSQDMESEGKRRTSLKEMYRRVLMKGVLIQRWSRILMRGTRVEKGEKVEGVKV